MSLNITVTPGSPTPIYRQIADQIRKAIAVGLLKNGEQIPSVRALAEKLLINPNTVAKAYNDLIHDGLIESQAGRGLFTTEKRSILSNEENQRRLNEAIDIFVSQISTLDLEDKEIRSLTLSRLDEFLKARKNRSKEKP